VEITYILSLLLLFSSFGNFTGLFLLNNFLDDTDSDGLFHVSNGKSSKRWVLIESFNAHWFLWDHSDHAGIS